MPRRLDRRAGAPPPGAVQDHPARPGQARDVRREGLVRRGHHRPARSEIGLPATPDESFILNDDDTVASVQQAHREACEASRRATGSLGLDDVLHGNRRSPLPLRWVYLHLLRELAQHCGHADILREQVLSQ